MGYTHYWTQVKSFNKNEWMEASNDIRKILTYINDNLVPLVNGNGDMNTQPEFTNSFIQFNGLDLDSCETFSIDRELDENDAFSFCKTNRYPYDIAVTACLCYLAYISKTHTISSDGSFDEFADGLDIVKRVLPDKLVNLSYSSAS